MSRLEQTKIDKYNDICNTPKISAQQLVDKILAGAFELDDLTNLEDPKRSTVEKSVNEARAKLPNEQEQADWNAIDLVNNDLRTKIHLLDTFIKKWSNIRPAQNHVDEAESELSKLMSAEWNDIVDIATQKKAEPINWKDILFDYIVVYEKDYSQKLNVDSASGYLKDAILREYNQIINDSTLTYTDKIAALSSFINSNTRYPVSAEYAELAKNEISKLKYNIEERQWAIVDKNDYDSLRSYLHEAPESCFLSDIDDAMWKIASLRGTDYIRRYISDMPAGKHIVDAKSRLEYVNEWERIQCSKDISEIAKYIQDNQYSPYLKEAHELIDGLKGAFLEDFYKNRQRKSHREIENLCGNNIFSYSDFVNHDITTDEIRLKNSTDSLSDFDDFETNTVLSTFTEASHATANDNIPLGHTDVFLFGVPTSGKTSVSMGLFKCKPELKIKDSTLRVGYSEVLEMYLDYCRMPDGTNAENTFLTQCEIKDGRVIHPINIIDMAGEVIAEKIARGDANTTLSDIPNLTRLLSTNNKKAIFFIVDPTSDVIPIKNAAGDRIVVSQASVISRIVNLLNAEKNKNVLNKIDAMHFIVTKSDMLGEDQDSRLNKAYDLMMSKYQGIIDQVIDISQENDINLPSRYIPTMYVFSLGEFYVGNSVVYNKEDSANIIEVIKEVTRGVKKANTLDKIKKFLNS